MMKRLLIVSWVLVLVTCLSGTLAAQSRSSRPGVLPDRDRRPSGQSLRAGLEKLLGGEIASVVPGTKPTDPMTVLYTDKKGPQQAQVTFVRDKNGTPIKAKVTSNSSKAMGSIPIVASRVKMCAKICNPLGGGKGELCFWICMIFD